MTKTLQRKDESPGDFYERLCEAFRIFTPFDPENPENQGMVNTAFVSQSARDKRRKLQKLEGFAGMNASQLLEVANKVYINREAESRREEDRRMKRKANLIAAALRQRGKGNPPHPHHHHHSNIGGRQVGGRKGSQAGPPLRRDQCAVGKPVIGRISVPTGTRGRLPCQPLPRRKEHCSTSWRFPVRLRSTGLGSPR